MKTLEWHFPRLGTLCFRCVDVYHCAGLAGRIVITLSAYLHLGFEGKPCSALPHVVVFIFRAMYPSVAQTHTSNKNSIVHGVMSILLTSSRVRTSNNNAKTGSHKAQHCAINSTPIVSSEGAFAMAVARTPWAGCGRGGPPCPLAQT